MAVQLALSLDATPPGTYRQRGTSSLQRLFRAHFPELVARYESEFAKQLGMFRLERISKAVERFLACGDYPSNGSGVFSRRESCRGIARIKCTNPDCGLEYFRPFSCSVFHVCPSCPQKRILLLGEYMNEQLLLRLPHRQFVFTLPKVLRVFFRNDTKVFPAVRFLAEVLLHLPDSRCRLIRTYGLYSSRARGAWFRQPHLVRLAPEGWKRNHQRHPSVRVGPPEEPPPQLSVSAKQSRAVWARLIKKVYEVDPLRCARCHGPMKIIAVIIDPAQVLKILQHLVKKGTPLPGLDPTCLHGSPRCFAQGVVCLHGCTVMSQRQPASDHDLWHAPRLLCSTDSAGGSAFAEPPPFASAIPFLPRGARRRYNNRYHSAPRRSSSSASAA